ncbi:MAG: tetratricopeptide repeat protein [Saprospiraceae bacterium]|nr:tetratricopeptide repeat protein [Saprospiraceae bacterium]
MQLVIMNSTNPMNLNRKPRLLKLMILMAMLVCGKVEAQVGPKDPSQDAVTIGKSYSISSSILGEDRPYLVYLPDDYNPSGDPIAVLYLLDGSGHFHHTTGIVSFLKNQGRIPNMLVVAIPNTSDRTHDLTPTIELDSSAKTGFPSAGGADKMLAFIRDELIPAIDSTYHTNSYRILVGHSFGGIFSVNALMKEPELFDAHISISPSMWWDKQNLVSRADSFLESTDTLDVFYYMTMGNEGGAMLGGAMKLAALFEEKSPQKFHWDFKVMEEETHGSIPHRSTYNGLESIFKDWFRVDLAELYTIGGLPAVDLHFKDISSKFGYVMHPSESQMNSLGYDFMNKNAYGKALDIFLENIKRFPKSSNVYDSVAEAYMELGEKDKAIEHYRKSLVINPGNANGVEKLKKLGIDFDPMKDEISLSELQKKEIIGIYEAPEIGKVEITLHDDKLKVFTPGLPEQIMHAFPENKFVLTPANVTLTFFRNIDGNVGGFEVQQGIGETSRVIKKE